jgi:hypothetical protein
MSIVLTLNTEDPAILISQIMNIIMTYDGHIEKAEPLFDIENKKLEEWLIIQREKVQSKLWKKFLEGYPRALASKDIQMYIQGDKEFIECNETILEISNIKNKLQSIVKSFDSMSWMLSHITKLRVAELQDAVL